MSRTKEAFTLSSSRSTAIGSSIKLIASRFRAPNSARTAALTAVTSHSGRGEDQSRHCGVSAVGTAPQWLRHAAEGEIVGRAAGKSFARERTKVDQVI